MAEQAPVKRYAFFEHTADVGIRAEAATVEGVLEAAACGLRELIAEDSSLSAVQSDVIELSADEPALLLWKWLDELLYRFSTKRLLAVSFEWLSAGPAHLKVRIQEAVFDPKQHTQGREVKAVTRHALVLEQRNGGWYGQVIVDI